MIQRDTKNISPAFNFVLQYKFTFTYLQTITAMLINVICYFLSLEADKEQIKE